MTAQTKLWQGFLNACFGERLATDGIFGKQTQASFGRAKSLILQEVQKHSKEFRGFVAFRTLQAFNNQTTDYLLYVSNNEVDFNALMPCSTRAGDFWVFNPITHGGITGVAVLAEGFYPKTWQASYQTRFGFKSVELLQIKPVKVWRDGNRNRQIDKTNPQVGLFGINIHTAGWGSVIDRWSAGCVVVPKVNWDAFTTEYIQIGELYDLLLLENGLATA